jgi:hypothetical protein
VLFRNSESQSGDGSTVLYTGNVRSLLAYSIKKYNIKDWVDSPCGDCNWQHLVHGFESVSYLGLDIVPGIIEQNTVKYANRTNMSFKVQDFINEPFTHKPELILCRDMIQHNSLVDGVRAYYNMEKSGAQFMATTWHNEGGHDPIGHNVNVPPGGMYRVNIFLHPFNFSRPEFWIREGEHGSDPEGKMVGLFKLPALGMGGGQMFELSAADLETAKNNIIQVPKWG